MKASETTTVAPLKKAVTATHYCECHLYVMGTQSSARDGGRERRRASCMKIVGCFVYLDKSEELRVVLHLPACELETLFFLPTVVLIGGEKLMEL